MLSAASISCRVGPVKTVIRLKYGHRMGWDGAKKNFSRKVKKGRGIISLRFSI
jgi:hypothetical protein